MKCKSYEPKCKSIHLQRIFPALPELNLQEVSPHRYIFLDFFRMMDGWLDANIYAWSRPRSGRGLPPKWKRVLLVLTVTHRTQKKASHRSYYTELDTCLGQRGPAARSLWNHRGLHCTVVLLFTWFCICWNNLEAIQMFFFFLPIWERGRRVVK